MSDYKMTAKSVLRKIQKILCCQICHNFFDFTVHKPIISFTGETFCKECIINKKNQRPESLITNSLIEIIIQEISNFFEMENLVYTKPGLKSNKSPSTTKNIKQEKLNEKKEKISKYVYIENNDKDNLCSNNNCEENKLVNESITTIPFYDELGNISNLSFRNEINNFIEDSPSKNVNNENKNQLNILKEEKGKKLKTDNLKIYISPKTQTQKNIIFRNNSKKITGKYLTFFNLHEVNDENILEKKKSLLEKINGNKNSIDNRDVIKNNEQELSLNKNLNNVKSNKSISHFNKLFVNTKMLMDKNNLRYSNVSSSKNLLYLTSDLFKTVEDEDTNQKPMNTEININKNGILLSTKYKNISKSRYNYNIPSKEKLIKYKKYYGTVLNSNKELMGRNTIYNNSLKTMIS